MIVLLVQGVYFSLVKSTSVLLVPQFNPNLMLRLYLMCYLITPPDRGMIQRVQESRVAPVKVRGVKGEVGLKLFIEIILQTCKYSVNLTCTLTLWSSL